MLLRLIFIAATPQLSDDYHRFYWDAHIAGQNINPYAYKPSSINLNETGLQPSYFELLNSKEYYSVYPPILQATYQFAHSFGSNKASYILLSHLLFYALALLFFYVLRLIFITQKITLNGFMLLWLNPLFILEFQANFHAELFMIIGLSASYLFTKQQKPILAAIFFALAVSTKLYPILLAPLFFFAFDGKNKLKFTLISSLFCFLALYKILPYYDNFLQSIKLYYATFEFNASFYYLLRQLGFYIKGYNMIAVFGRVLGAIPFMVVAFFALKKMISKKQKLAFAICISLLSYNLAATTVMPWYISGTILFSVLSGYSFGVIWSALISLSYWSYSANGFSENLYLVTIEYALLFAYMIYEFSNKKHDFFELQAKEL